MYKVIISADIGLLQRDTQVLNLLSHLKAQRIAPDVCIISPFRNVIKNLRESIQSSNILKGWLQSEKEIDLWLNENIGTIHTMQGREKEAIILVLGGQSSGARNWAGKEPNILNVAVTPAKEAIYVVGNRTLWKECGVFKTLHKSLPDITAPDLTPDLTINCNLPAQHKNEVFINNEPFDDVS